MMLRGLRAWLPVILIGAVMVAACSRKSEEIPVSVPTAAEDACNPAQSESPRPTQLLYLSSKEIEYGDSLPLIARLTDQDGQPLVGRELRFVLGAVEATATTGALGLAQVTVTPSTPPGVLPLTVSYGGDATTASASASASVIISKAASVTRFLGPTLLSIGTPQQVRATLVRVRNHIPIAGRTLIFEAGGARAMGTTDATGVATALLSWNGDTTGPAVLRVSFSGDDFYEPSSDESPITRYLPTAFAVWGGNSQAVRLGQRVNFWGHSWSDQVKGGDYDSHAEFKGFATALRAFSLCQPTARTDEEPRLTSECWSSKGGQGSPPERLPEYIGVLVTDSIIKEQGQIYGNVAALGVLKVDPMPAYRPVPGKPGWGTLVAIIEGGTLFPRPASLAVSQQQPGNVRPGQGFEVTVEVENTSQVTAEQVIVTESFNGSLPAFERKDVGTLDPGEHETLVFSQTAPTVPARGTEESVNDYQARLAAADGRLLPAAGRVRFVDPHGATPPTIDLFSSSQLQLPRLAVALSPPSCVTPCVTGTYVITATNLGRGRAASVTVTLTLPDGTQQVRELGAIEPSGVSTSTVEWTASTAGPRRPDESLEEYLARLRAWAEQTLLASAELVWRDEGGTAYGPIDRAVTTVPQIPILSAAAEAPSSVLPGQAFPLQFTVNNIGTARADDARIHLTETGATSPAFTVASGQPTTLSMEVAAPPVSPRGSAEREEEYRMRLAAANGQTLTYNYSLDWGTACGARLGAIPGSVQTIQVLPTVTVSLAGPTDAPAGGTLAYTATLQNAGYADAVTLELSVALPDGSVKKILQTAGPLARGESLQVPFTYTLPAAREFGSEAVTVASIRWMDAVGNAYGPLSAGLITRVNHPPQVWAGADQTITLPGAASLAGSIQDDGLPEGVTPTAAWVQVSGPAPVRFVNPANAHTSVIFTAAGTYVLGLTGSDSHFAVYDELTVTVQPPPSSGTAGFTVEVFSKAMSMDELAPIIHQENAQWYAENGYEFPDWGITYPDRGITYPDNGIMTVCPPTGGDFDGDGLLGTDDTFPATLGPMIADFPTINVSFMGELTADIKLKVSSTEQRTVNLTTLDSNSYRNTRSATDTLEIKSNYTQKLGSSTEAELGLDIAKLVKLDFTGVTGKATQKFTQSSQFEFSTSLNRTLKDEKVTEIVSKVSHEVTEVATTETSFDAESGRIKTTWVVRNGSTVPRNLEIKNLRFLIMAHDPVSGTVKTFAKGAQTNNHTIVVGWGANDTYAADLLIEGLNTKDMLDVLGRGWTIEVIPAPGYLLLDANTNVVLNNVINQVSQRTALFNLYWGGMDAPIKRRVSTVTPGGDCTKLREFLVNAVGAGNIDFKVNAQGKLVVDRIYGKRARHDDRDFDSLSETEKDEYAKWVVTMYGHPDRHPFMPEDFGLEDMEVYAPGDQIYVYLITREDLHPTSGPLFVDYYDDSIGIIPETPGVCPARSERVWIYLDNQNGNNNENDRAPWIGATESGRNTRFEFCRVDGTKFRRFQDSESYQYHYAVLKLDQNCPVGAVEFSRYFDDEDGSRDNENANSGNIWPSEQGLNTTLRFCLFRKDTTRADRSYGVGFMKAFPDLGIPYGVFVDQNFDRQFLKADLGWVYTDDEDSNNENGYWAPNDAIKQDAMRIVAPQGTDGRNTKLYMSKVRN